MNTLTLYGVTPEPSLAEQARRLELFEIALREERIAELEKTIEQHEACQVDFVQRLPLQDGDVLLVPEASYPLVSDLAKLVSEQGFKNVLLICGELGHLDENARRAIAKPFTTDLRHMILQLQHERQQLLDDNAQVRTLQDELQQRVDQVNELEAKHLAATRSESRLLEQVDALKEQLKELKRLRELNPDAMRKRLDRLKKDKADQAAAIAELRRSNKALQRRNRQLDKALQKACDDINAAQKLEPIRVIEPARLGRWELYSYEVEGAYQVLDVENETSRTVRVDAAGELTNPKLRPLPKAIATWVTEVHAEYFGGQSNG